MVVAGGGTGGHFFPGLAVAEAAVAQGDVVTFVGSRTGIEARVVPARGFRFDPLDIHGVRGLGWRGVLRFAYQFPLALTRSWRMLREVSADVVLGLGGYGSVPVVLGAWLRGVPAVLMEQNVHPGMANRLLARVAARVCTTFIESDSFFPSNKAVRTGNPTREFETREGPDPECFTVLVFGGSQGARSLNQAMTDAAPLLVSETGRRVRIVHQTGANDQQWVAESYRAAGLDAAVTSFIDDMGRAYARADLVVCRSGATTLAELASVGKAAILVPYPFAADDHQRHNADAVAARGAAEVILDRELTGERIALRIRHFVAHPDELATMGVAARTLATPSATSDVLQVCREVFAKEQ